MKVTREPLEGTPIQKLVVQEAPPAPAVATPLSVGRPVGRHRSIHELLTVDDA